LDRGEYVVEEVSDGFKVADHKHMSGVWDDVGLGGEADGEDLVAAAMDMVEGLRDGRVRLYTEFDDHGKFEEAGRYESFELEGTCDAIKFGQVGGNGDAADEDRANRGDAFGHFHCHDAAEGEACEDKRFRCVDLLHEPVGVVAELFFSYGGYPMNIGGFVAFG
jgi:hypothetical protein